MECNRDEAIRAKSIAESKLEKQDLAGAKKFALKAQNLYPQLDGISQFLSTIDVYASAEKKNSGEVDWYAVLSVNPFDKEETIKKQFRKLALLLHPDKNKSVGANGAFELISTAWSMLSDKSKRYAYDRRRGCEVIQQKPLVPSGGPPAQPPTENQFPNSVNRTTSVPKTQNFSAPKTQNSNAKKPKKSNPAPCRKPKDCFMTKCDKCKFHYEHVIKYLNCTLLCPRCNEAFLAVETDPPKSIAPVDSFWTVCNHCKMYYEHRKMYLNRTLLCPNCKKAFLASETAPPIIKAEKKRKLKK